MTRLIALLGVLVLGALILPNLRSLYEGIFHYLRDTLTYSTQPARPVRRDGRYASLFDLVHMRNVEREGYITRQLLALGLSVSHIPIPNSTQTNIFVRRHTPGPYTIFSAHYDKLFDDPIYQGASDNSAAVSVILASIEELTRRGVIDSRAFLFIGEEETGLRGASAFVEYVRANNITIREIINFDNLGRGKLGIRPSAEVPGFVFTIPFLRDYAFDGRQLRPSSLYPPASARLTRAVRLAQPEVTVFKRFTARSDSNVFQANGFETVAISGDNMRYLELTWHTYADVIELLDEDNLDLAYDLILRYSPKN